MDCQFSIILILTVSGTVVQAKTFLCEENYSIGRCTITDVHTQDNRIYLISSSYKTISNLTILNSTMDDIPPISSSYSISLRYLNCIGCGLADITKHSFAPIPNLFTLNISFGSYKKLNKNLFSELTTLNLLNVSHGAIIEIDDAAFYNLKSLVTLTLSSNNITRITAKMFTPLENVRMLDLSYNHIETLDSGLFANNTNLIHLDLRYNDINRIDGRIFPRQSVVACSIIISYNKLTTLDLALLDTPGVLAEGNQINQINCNNSSKVTQLDLSNNSLTELGCISSLTQLTNLSLNYNNLGKLNQSSFAALTELRHLCLVSANIRQLEYGIFSHQNQLIHLDISKNHMGHFAMDLLLAARGLQFLYIDGNNITEFAYDDLKAFIFFQAIGIGNNDFNCTYLAQAVKYLNSNNITAIVASGQKVTDSHSINGIGCHDKKETDTPSWMPSGITNDNTTSAAVNTTVNVSLEAIIQQVDKVTKTMVEHEKYFKTLSEDIGAVKQQNFQMNSDVLTIKGDILKIELAKNNDSTSSSNAWWTQINQLNNITLEKQQISHRTQTQEIAELKFEIDKIGHKLGDVAAKMEKLMKEMALLPVSSSSGTTKTTSDSDYGLIRNVNIILITLILAFCVYKGYKFVRDDLPRIKRYNTANTLHTNIEMDSSSSK